MISMKLLGSASVAALLVLAGCEATDKAATDVKSAAQAQTTPTLSTTDATFINTASQAGVEEIKFAQLAETQSHSARVKKFAMQMVTDHTAANEKLTALAQQKGITPTTTTDTAHDQMYTQLQGEHGRTFDRDYLAGQIKDHQMVADAMQTEIQSGTDGGREELRADDAADHPAASRDGAGAGEAGDRHAPPPSHGGEVDELS